MTPRHLLLAMALIAFVLTPLLACCGSASAAEQEAASEHACGHADQAPPPPIDHADCDGCDECAPVAVVTAPKIADQAPAMPTDAPAWTSLAVAVPARVDPLWPPGRAPPRPTPAHLHDKLTV